MCGIAGQIGRDPRVIMSLIHIFEPTRLRRSSYVVFCLKKKRLSILQAISFVKQNTRK